MAWNKLANSVRGTLTASINDSVTAMGVTLASGSASYPASIDADNPIYLTIHNAANFLVHEIVKVTEVSGADVVTMVRAQRGTSALSWSAGAVVSLNLHAQDITEMRAFIDADGNAALVNVVASGNISGVNITASGVVALAAGSAAAPALTLGDSGTGQYRPAENQIAWAVAFTQRALLSSSGWDVTGTRLQVTNSGAGAQFNVYTYRDSATLSSGNFFSARGSLASPATLQTNDVIATINARPWQTGTTFSTGSGLLRWLATENHSSTANGTKAQIYVTANGGTSLALGLEIDQDRKLTVPGSFAHTGSTFGALNTTPTTKQTVTGSRGSNAALASLLTALANYGLVTNSTTA